MVPIRFGGVLYDTYPIVSWCIMRVVSCRIHVSWVYLDVSQMYLKCSVTFQQNTCILTFCMYFTRRDLFQTSPRYILDTHKIHHYTCILLASYAPHWIHIRYIRIRLSWNLHRDTSRLQNYDKRHVYVRNTFRIHDGIHVSQMHAERHVSETYLRLVWDT